MNDFSINPVPSWRYILFSLTTPRRVANVCDSVRMIENRAERLHTSATFEATCVRNVLIVKHLEHEKFKDWYHVKEERLFYRPLHSESYVTFTLTTRNRVASFCDKHPQSKSWKLLFGCCCCFRAYCLITTQWNVKGLVPCKR